MESGEDQVIEVAGGGEESIFTDMIYYDSWTNPTYTYTVNFTADPPNSDLISYTAPDSGGTVGTKLAASLWLFNDGTTPIPSNKIKYYLSNPKITKIDFTGIFNTTGLEIRPILSTFDPSLITTIDELIALTSSGRVTVDVNAIASGGVSGGVFSLSEANYFYTSPNSSVQVFGLVILYSATGNVGGTANVDIQPNSKTLKVILT